MRSFADPDFTFVEIDRLFEHADVLKYPPWGLEVNPITFRALVEYFANHNDVLSYPVKDHEYDNKEDLVHAHARRCAYFALNPNYDPISIDVGIPGLLDTSWIVDDGNHRLYGRAIAGEISIKASVSGSVSRAKSMLGVSL